MLWDWDYVYLFYTKNSERARDEWGYVQLVRFGDVKNYQAIADTSAKLLICCVLDSLNLHRCIT